jgi:peptidoglycan/xylan/chitin deacetylase (PgdA/CDA1 family)
MTARALATILLAFVSMPLAAAKAHTDLSGPAATILCYHIVESPQDPRMEVSRDAFRQQMRYLALTGYNVIPLRWVYEYIGGQRESLPSNAIVVTIDDGWRSTYTEVFPEMQHRKFPFTVFIYPKIIGQTAHALTWKQVKEMAAAGVDIQSHSWSHPFLTQRRHASLGEKQYQAWLEHELVDSKRILERETGKPVSYLAYPYGDYDHYLAAAVARAGYTAALTCDYGRVLRGSDPLRMKRFVVDKRMDFAAFRHYLGAGQMRIEEATPIPGQVVEPEQQPLIVSARIPNYRQLDPNSVGMTVLGASALTPFSYDANDGSISMVVRDAFNALKGQYQRALVWATDAKTGKRVEASWTFRVPDPANILPQMLPETQPSLIAPGSPSSSEPAQPREMQARQATALAAAGADGGDPSHARLQQRAPK